MQFAGNNKIVVRIVLLQSFLKALASSLVTLNHTLWLSYRTTLFLGK